MLNELIQTFQMVLRTIEHYGACFGDDIDAKMNYFKHIIQCILNLNRRIDD